MIKPKKYFNQITIPVEGCVDVVVDFRVDHQLPDISCTDSDVDYYGFTEVFVYSMCVGDKQLMTDNDVEELELLDIHTYEELEDYCVGYITIDKSLWEDVLCG